jgi:antirestriction protein ArdC
MPRIDTGPTDGPPGNELQTAWVELSTGEAYELLESLKMWAEEVQEGHPDPGWHTHVSDSSGRELTVSIRTPDDSNARA